MTRRWFLLPVVGGLVLILDQLTKWLVTTNLQLGESWYPIPQISDWFAITRWSNTGAAFGLFPQLSAVFAVIAVLVSFGIVWYYGALKEEDWLIRLSLGLQLGGALGNLVDRLRLGGSVVDFIHVSFWPVFNVADSAVVCGVILLIWRMMRTTPAPHSPLRDTEKSPE